jgi:hypothetical protein
MRRAIRSSGDDLPRVSIGGSCYHPLGHLSLTVLILAKSLDAGNSVGLFHQNKI